MHLYFYLTKQYVLKIDWKLRESGADMDPRSFAGRNPPVSKSSFPHHWLEGPPEDSYTRAYSETLRRIVIVLASDFRPPPDMSAYLLNLIKIFS